MSVIPFESKSVRKNESKLENQEPQSLSNKVIHLTRFARLRQSAHWENIKLRNGLVLKVHQVRKQAELTLQAVQAMKSSSETISLINEAQEEILSLASDYADFVLYEEVSTMELLNKYWEFKNTIEKKVKEVSSSYLG